MSRKSFWACWAMAVVMASGCGRGPQTEKAVGVGGQPAGEAGQPAAEAVQSATETAKPATEAGQPAGAAAPPGVKLAGVPESGLVPAECFFAVVIHPQRIFQSPQAAQSAEVKRLLEGEGYQRVVKQIGFDLRDLEAVTFLVSAPLSPKDDVPEPAVVLRFAGPIDRDRIIGNLGGQGYTRSEQTHAGKTYYKLSPPAERRYAHPRYLLAPDERTIAFAERDEELVRKMLAAAGKESPLADALRRADMNHDVVGVTVMQPVQAFVEGLAARLPPDAPAEFAELKALAGRVKGATFAADVFGDPFAKATLQTDSPETAGKLLPMMKKGQEMLSGLLEFQKKRQAGLASKPRESDVAMEELSSQFLGGLSISQREAGLEAVVRLKNPELVFWLIRGPVESRKEIDKLLVRMQIEIFRGALEMYRLETGAYPTTKQGLEALVKRPADLDQQVRWAGPYTLELPKDPWGRDYQYRYPPKRGNPEQPEIWSDGPDGQSGTPDDIGTWDQDAGPGRVKVSVETAPPVQGQSPLGPPLPLDFPKGPPPKDLPK